MASMLSQIRAIVKTHKNNIEHKKELKLSKHLNADALFSTMKIGFEKLQTIRPGSVQHSLGDTLMAGFAMFSLKDPSLLEFDKRRFSGPHSLMTINGLGSIPSDTSMREILDGVS